MAWAFTAPLPMSFTSSCATLQTLCAAAEVGLLLPHAVSVTAMASKAAASIVRIGITCLSLRGIW